MNYGVQPLREQLNAVQRNEREDGVRMFETVPLGSDSMGVGDWFDTVRMIIPVKGGEHVVQSDCRGLEKCVELL